MKPERIRLFVAVSIRRSHLDHVDREIAAFKDKVTNARWAVIENQHVTLKFLGPTPTDRLADVSQVCSMVASGRTRASVRLSGIGAFPSRTRVRVLWIGFDDPDGVMTGLAADLNKALEPLGYAAEARAFTPHLTLARFRIPVPLKGGLPEVDVSGLDPFTIEEIHLFRSHLSPKGARYEVLESFPLAE